MKFWRFPITGVIAVGLSAALHTAALPQAPTTRLFFLDIRGGRVVSSAPDGSDVREILMRNLKEAIGIALDLRGGRLYATDLGGTVYSARLDGSDQKVVLTGQGSLTGIAVVRSR